MLEIFKIFCYLFIGGMALFFFFWGLSTDQTKRRNLGFGAVLAGLVYIVSLELCLFINGYRSDLMLLLNLGIGFGITWPLALAGVIVRRRIEAPIWVLKTKKTFSIVWIIYLAAFVFFISQQSWAMVHSFTTKVSATPQYLSSLIMNRPVYDRLVYDENGIGIVISYLLYLIPLAILGLYRPNQKIAFCENGFYQGSLLDWSNFEGYSWENRALYDDPEVRSVLDKDTRIELVLHPRKISFLPFTKQVRILVPYMNKPAIEALLSRNIRGS